MLICLNLSMLLSSLSPFHAKSSSRPFQILASRDLGKPAQDIRMIFPNSAHSFWRQLNGLFQRAMRRLFVRLVVDIVFTSLFTKLSPIDYSLPCRLLVILCPTPIPAYFTQHQISNGNRRASTLERKFCSELWSKNDGVIPICDGQGIHLFCVFFRHLSTVAYIYWYIGL